MTIIKTEMLTSNMLVEKFVGTAYDKMAELHANLPALLELYASLNEFNATYQGALDEAPTTRPDGEPLEEGDTYFDNIDQTTYYFSQGEWVSSNNISTSVQVHTVSIADIDGLDTVITFPNSFSTVSGGLMVFVGPAYQYDIANDPTGAYEIVDSTTIRFPNVQLQVDEQVIIVSGIPVSTISPIVSVNSAYYVIETEGQTQIPVPSNINYVPGNGNLAVYYGGEKLVNGLEFIESSPSYIDLVNPASLNDVVEFVQGNLVSSESNAQNDAITIPLLGSFNANQTLLEQNKDKAVLVKGGYSLADGSGGMYVYDESFPKAQANGVTAIDATVTSGQQGTGIGNGCWMRQYEGFIKPEWFNSPYRGMATLRLLSPLDGDKVNLDGFYEDAVTGGGTFVWDGARLRSEHDGGSIISPNVIAAPGTNDWYTAPLTGNHGCWVRQDTASPNTDWFGADNTGVTNADAAFSAMDNYPGSVAIKVINGQYNLTGDHSSGLYYSIGPIIVVGGATIIIQDILL